MDKIGGFAFSALVYSCYWISLGVERRPGSAEDRVLRYQSEVYGSVIDTLGEPPAGWRASGWLYGN
ncbi:MAG: hypothetical protein PHG39_02535 [Acidithiobacillus ferrooxidans]|jgi:hypothetical protein|uniref:hypothetical protein n=1 Tax=Acidithiobacillus sp. TaxID=1872118 RepID=UPI001C065344|nr:hypothetical protein [Acidithiobacillus ferruginosus]MBU2813572.1 hypothetical protein [Acidithiobacillus ferruginosus]MDD2746411.1 hypothetical protein [Acidithiobacillus ferrooxidans]MDD5004633.1 hypothetical protein [Acidithiobacillus sp.]